MSFSNSTSECTRGFSFQLLKEVLQVHNFPQTLQTLQEELQQKPELDQVVQDTSIWMEMFQRCNLNALTGTSPGASTVEKLLYHLLQSREAQASNNKAPDLVSIVSSPKKQTHTSYSTATIKSIVRPSQRQETLPHFDSPSGKLKLKPRVTIPSPERTPVKKSKLRESQSLPRLRKSPNKQLSQCKAATKPKPKAYQLVLENSELESTNPALSPIQFPSPQQRHQHDRTSRMIRRDLIQWKKDYQDQLKAEASPPKDQRVTRKPTLEELEQQRHKANVLARKLDKLKRQPCALCRVDFPLANLKFQIPFKSIIDMHAKWNYASPLANSAKYKAPLCYDTVKVCCFCAQLLQDPSVYRPTTKEKMDQRKTKKRTKKKKKKKGPSPPPTPAPSAPETCDPLQDPSEGYPKALEAEFFKLLKKYGAPSDSLHQEYEDLVQEDDSSSDKSEDETAVAGLTTGGNIGKELVYKEQSIHSNYSLSQQEWSVIRSLDENSLLSKAIRRTIKLE